MTTIAAAPAPEERLAQMIQERADRKEEEDLPRSMTLREVSDYVACTRGLDGRIHALRVAISTRASLPSLDHLTQWRDQLTTWRQILCDEVAALPARLSTGHQIGVAQNLMLSIRFIDGGSVDGTGYALETLRLGALMREAGYVAAAPVDGQSIGRLPWFGALPEVEYRIREVTKRRAESQAALDDAMLDDAERERLARERAVRVTAANAGPQRKTRGDGTQYDKYPDGRIVEVTA
jgi:hypothetical protein